MWQSYHTHLSSYNNQDAQPCGSQIAFSDNGIPIPHDNGAALLLKVTLTAFENLSKQGWSENPGRIIKSIGFLACSQFSVMGFAGRVTDLDATQSPASMVH